MITADRPAVGIQKNALVKPYRATMTTMAVMMPAAGVRTPDFDLSAERGERPSGRIRAKDRANGVCYSNSNKFLIRG